MVGGSSPPGSVMAKPDFNNMSEDEAKKFISEHIKKRFTKNGPILGKLPNDYREDALNEVFVDLWTNRFNYNPKLADFTTYAYNRGRGVVKSMLQSYGRLGRIRSKLGKSGVNTFHSEISDYENKEFCTALMSDLSQQEIEIMKMRFLESMHINEIATNLKLNPQKVYSIIREAKSKCIKSKWNQG